MSDDLLLSLPWFVPLAGCLIVLLIPKRAELAIKGFSLGVTLVTFALCLVALSVYVAPDSAAATPLAQRAANAGVTAGSETGNAVNDLVVRHAWIPDFNIQYYL